VSNVRGGNAARTCFDLLVINEARHSNDQREVCYGLLRATMRTTYRDWNEQEKVAIELGAKERLRSSPRDYYYSAITD
jgi:hypothetical protein